MGGKELTTNNEYIFRSQKDSSWNNVYYVSYDFLEYLHEFHFLIQLESHVLIYKDVSRWFQEGFY